MKLSERGTTTVTENGLIHIIIPNISSPTGFDSFKILIDDLTAGIDHNLLDNVDLAASTIAFGHIDDQAQNIHGIKTFKDEILYHDDDTLKARIYTASDQGRIDLYNVDDEVGLRLSGHSDSYFDAFVAVGHRIPLATLHAKYSSGAEPIMFVESTQGANTSNGLYVKAGTSASDYCARFDNKDGTSYMRITGNGNVVIGTPTIGTATSPLHVNGAITMGREGSYGMYVTGEVQGIWSIGSSFKIDTVANDFGNQFGLTYAYNSSGPINGFWANEHQILFVAQGVAQAGISLSTGKAHFNNTVTATNFILSSDKRLKENIKPISDKGIGNVELKQFTFKSDESKRLSYGVIAQDLEKTHPEMVFENSDKMKQVDYTAFLLARIDNLEKRLQKLEA